MDNQLALIQASEWNTLLEMAGTFVQSGFLPQAINTPQKAVTIILAGRSYGIDAWTALMNMNVINGKPTASAQLMLALINRSGQLEDMEVTGDDTHCTVVMKRVGRAAHVETFTIEDARRFKTKEKDRWISLSEKFNWTNQPATMLKWRAICACARVVFPDALLGLYTPEEMGADVRVSDDGGMEILTPDTPTRHGNGDNRRLELPAPDYVEADADGDAEMEARADFEAFLADIYSETQHHFPGGYKHFLNLLNNLFPDGIDDFSQDTIITAINEDRASQGKANKGWWQDASAVKRVDGFCVDKFGVKLWDILAAMGNAKMGDYGGETALWNAILDAHGEGTDFAALGKQTA